VIWEGRVVILLEMEQASEMQGACWKEAIDGSAVTGLKNGEICDEEFVRDLR